MIKFDKFEKNPILVPDKNNWFESGAVFNCGTIMDENNVIHMLYRAIPGDYEKTDDGLKGEYISYLGYAKSTDGMTFQRHSEPVMKPDHPFDKYGCEDPRIVKIEGIDPYIVTYTAISQSLTNKPDFRECVRLAMASTTDFMSFEKYGITGPEFPDKDAVIFPKLINGKIGMLHRIDPDIQLALFDDFEQFINPGKKYWEDHMNNLEKHTIMKPEYDWEAKKIGAGPTPIYTEEGWLLIYHGVNDPHTRKISDGIQKELNIVLDDRHVYYCGGAVLLDLEDPSRIIAKIPHPILLPTESHETNGDVPNVVFPEGAVILNEELFVYYGGGDTCCCGAKTNFKEFMDYLLKFKI